LRAQRCETPILMLTARHEVSDRVSGLDAGADDYLPKPFSLDELLARLRALLRRTSVSGADEQLRIADLTLDPQRRTASRAGRPLELTKTEFDLLELLMLNAGIVLSRETIYDRIWGFDFETGSRSLDVYIGYLRRKTEAEGEARLVHTVRGVGYVVRESP
jgi:two-component system response regulator MprA